MSPHERRDHPSAGEDPGRGARARWFRERWVLLVAGIVVLAVVVGVAVDFIADDRVYHERIEDSINPPYGGS